MGSTGTAGELRIDDLARAAGTTVRNVRAYQDRGLIPPPRREGRAAWYGEAHLARLRLITSLLDRGFSLANIGELLDVWDDGRDLGDLLGLGEQLLGPFTDEVADEGPAAEIVARYRLRFDDPEAVRLTLLHGLVEVHDDRLLVPSPRLLRAGVAMQAAGVPVTELFEELVHIRAAVGDIAARLVRLVVDHVIEPRLVDDVPAPGDEQELAEALARIQPFATSVVSAELARALHDRAEADFGERLARILGQAPPAAEA